MKVFAFIISFIVLGLSCLPCSDVKDFITNEVNQQAATTQTTSDTEDLHLDLCNPFCSCACCGVTPSNHRSVFVSLDPPKHIASYVDSYSSCSVRAMSFPIWQPPQLAS